MFGDAAAGADDGDGEAGAVGDCGAAGVAVGAGDDDVEDRL